MWWIKYLVFIYIDYIIYGDLSGHFIVFNLPIHKSLSHLIFQLLDIELFRALYINYLANKTEPCDPQRFITAIEASLESAPQTLIQMIYLVGQFIRFKYYCINLLLSSLWSIISKLVSDDK